MSAQPALKTLAGLPSGSEAAPDVVEIATSLAPSLAERSAEIDQNDRFVAENYALLKEAGLVEAGVPAELGGGGAAAANR